MTEEEAEVVLYTQDTAVNPPPKKDCITEFEVHLCVPSSLGHC